MTLYKYTIEQLSDAHKAKVARIGKELQYFTFDKMLLKVSPCHTLQDGVDVPAYSFRVEEVVDEPHYIVAYEGANNIHTFHDPSLEFIYNQLNHKMHPADIVFAAIHDCYCFNIGEGFCIFYKEFIPADSIDSILDRCKFRLNSNF